LHQVGDLFELNVILRCQKVKGNGRHLAGRKTKKNPQVYTKYPSRYFSPPTSG